LFFTPERLTRAEKRVVTEADRVVTESPDATRHYAESYGANPGKFIDACNYVDLDLFLNIAIDSNIVERYSSDFTITYVGGIGQHKGMDEVVEAVKIVSEHIDDCRLVVVGGGGYAETLAARVREVGLSDRVEMVGQVPYERVPSYIAASKLCISPVRALSEDAHTSTYHKVFEYMALGKPVVVSDTRVMARIIKDAGCGLLFEPGNSRDLAAKILELTDERLRIEMGERAMRAVKEKYNWASQGEKLVRLYTEIEEHAGRA
jgi:glycosyltransferase involved in cell wall biosynthesis